MRLQSLLFVMLLLLAAGCATYRDDSLARMNTLPLHYEKFDVQMAWEVTSAQGSTVITGVVKNIRYFEMSQLQIQVSSLDDNGKKVHQSGGFYKYPEGERSRLVHAEVAAACIRKQAPVHLQLYRHVWWSLWRHFVGTVL